MPVVLALLQIVGCLCLVVLALMVIALLLPLGFAVEYRPGRFRVSAVYGPFRRTVWARRIRRKNIRQPVQKQGEKEAKSQPSAMALQSIQTERTLATAPPQDLTRRMESAGENISEPSNGPAAQASAQDEEEEELPSGALGRVEQAVTLLEENPRALAECVLGHVRWLHRHSMFKIGIRHVYVFWTVHCEDAAATAVAYGAEMAAFNTALELLQQAVHLQSDRLWLEPDFTGQRFAERKISCLVSARAILMLHLLYRIWKDPLLQPAASETP